MATFESVSQILTQVITAGKRRMEGGHLSKAELDALRTFTNDVGKLVARLDRRDPTVTNATLGNDLVSLLSRCTGPLERYRGWVEDALSVIGTVSS